MTFALKLAGALFALLLLGVFGTCGDVVPPPSAPLPQASEPVSYDAVRTVFDRRCVVCHGCYDAPCQLLLSSPDGLARGASKDSVYHSERLKAAPPTRLGLDAHAMAAWRQKGFFPVLDPGAPARSLLAGMLALGRAHPFPPGEKLPEKLPLDVTRELSCPTVEEFPRYARENPQGGMPYGMAPLSEHEFALLAGWLAQGSPPPPPRPFPAAAAGPVERWERFLNGDTPKQRLIGRYLFEHWVFAHLHFGELPEAGFFQVLRSRTPPGQPLDPIATRRPFDDPGVARVWYRIVPLDETIVHKTHILYRLDDARMRRLRELFVDTAWEPTGPPVWGNEASNPFVSFEAMPPRSRYQFLLDDAHYFITTFIRGPVCRGQVAVDVIEDHFFMAFLDPDHDPAVRDPSFLGRVKKLLDLPAEHGSGVVLGGLWLEFAVKQRRYIEERRELYDRLDPQRRGPTLDMLWDGDGRNRSALLTVFRHFDNATVVEGFVGEWPETAWVLDYALFERIYYDLVAGFDVFGNVTHQVSTRLYMDHLRMQAENIFLSFLPSDRRHEIRASWYVGATDEFTYEHIDELASGDHETRVPFATDDPVSELLAKLEARSRAVSGPPDLLNRCASPPCARAGASAAERRIEAALQRVTGRRGPWVAPLPELVLLRVRSDALPGGGAVYALAHGRAHTNVASMFDEKDRLEPEKDTLVAVRGLLGSYPNFAFDVRLDEVEAFADALVGVRGDAGLEALAERFGVRRSDPRFWAFFDWVHDDFRRREPLEAGLLDLARYRNL